MTQQLDQLLQFCTVKITVPGQPGWGTGCFVAPGLILTCAHVVKALTFEATAQIRWQQQENWASAELVQLLPKLDLALLQFISPETVPCVYLDEEIQVGHELYCFGYPDQDFPNGCPVTGSCEGFTGDLPPLIKFKSAQVRPGMSGAALLNRNTGKVCGVVKFTRDRSFDLGGGAIPTRVVLEQFPQLRELQQQFHQQDRRWIELLEAGTNLDDLLVQIEAGAITNADLQRLREVLSSGSSQLSQLGKYNINVGQGQDIHIGDRTYVEINEAAVAAIVAAIQQSVSATHPPPSPVQPPSPSPPPAVSSLKEAKPMPPANAIFISYRRSDSHDVTGRIYDRLSDHFGQEVVFKDVDSIPFGVDFRTHLNQGVGNCLVLIAVIGPTWLSAQDADGHRRIDNPNDWVRAEIETALARDIPVIPLLVGGARLPKVDELPESLKPLAYRNATQARPDPDFHRDMDRLIQRLEEIVGSAEPIKPMSSAQLLKLQHLQNKRNKLEGQLKKVQDEIEAVIDITIKDQYEQRLNLLFAQIEEVDQDIQKLGLRNGS